MIGHTDQVGFVKTPIVREDAVCRTPKPPRGNGGADRTFSPVREIQRTYTLADVECSRFGSRCDYDPGTIRQRHQWRMESNVVISGSYSIATTAGAHFLPLYGKLTPTDLLSLILGRIFPEKMFGAKF
jgi:hypothetical protein